MEKIPFILFIYNRKKIKGSFIWKLKFVQNAEKNFPLTSLIGEIKAKEQDAQSVKLATLII